MKLNDAHDEWIKETIALAIQKVESERGPSPAHFAFFLMGSAGRKNRRHSAIRTMGLYLKAVMKSISPIF